MYPTCFSAYLQPDTPSMRVYLLCGVCVRKAVLTQPRESTEALLLRWYEISSLFVPKLHLVAQHVYVEQLPDVLLAVIFCGDAQTQSVRLGRLQGCRTRADIAGPGMSPVMVLFDANFFRIFPSSLSTLAFSCSLF